MLGFTSVYHYVPGKVDWLAHKLPVEGDRPEPPTVGRVLRDDAARCGPDDPASEVLAAIERTPYPFGLVTSEGGIVLGRARASVLRAESDRTRTVGEVMELGPWTVRPHRSADATAKRLADKNLRWAIVTTPGGRLLGVASRADLEGIA